MTKRWFPNTQAIECDLVLVSSGRALRTVLLPMRDDLFGVALFVEPVG